MAHEPEIITYDPVDEKWFGLEARRVNTGFDTTIFLIPLPGHTLGHCGVAIQQRDNWIFHMGDTYYLRDELFI